jgi:hypothetical protein
LLLEEENQVDEDALVERGQLEHHGPDELRLLALLNVSRLHDFSINLIRYDGHSKLRKELLGHACNRIPTVFLHILEASHRGHFGKLYYDFFFLLY